MLPTWYGASCPPKIQIPAHAHGLENPINFQYIYWFTSTSKKECYLLLFASIYWTSHLMQLPGMRIGLIPLPTCRTISILPSLLSF